MARSVGGTELVGVSYAPDSLAAVVHDVERHDILQVADTTLVRASSNRNVYTRTRSGPEGFARWPTPSQQGWL
jgi:hypothetical protein